MVSDDGLPQNRTVWSEKETLISGIPGHPVWRGENVWLFSGILAGTHPSEPVGITHWRRKPRRVTCGPVAPELSALQPNPARPRKNSECGLPIGAPRPSPRNPEC